MIHEKGVTTLAATGAPVPAQTGLDNIMDRIVGAVEELRRIKKN